MKFGSLVEIYLDSYTSQYKASYFLLGCLALIFQIEWERGIDKIGRRHKARSGLGKYCR